MSPATRRCGRCHLALRLHLEHTMRSTWSEVIALPTNVAQQLRLNRMRREKPSGIIVRGKSINLCDISNLDLVGIRFVRCRFSGFGCGIRFGPILECDFRTSVVDNCRFLGLIESNLSDAIIERTCFDGPVQDCNFLQAVLDGSTFRQRPATRKDWCITADFSGAVMNHVDGVAAAFTLSRFDRCMIENSRLSRSEWHRCRTRFLRMERVNLLGAKFTPKFKPPHTLDECLNENRRLQPSLSRQIVAMATRSASLAGIANKLAPSMLKCTSVLASRCGFGSEQLVALFGGAEPRIHAFRASSQEHLRVYGLDVHCNSVPSEREIQCDFAGWYPVAAHTRCAPVPSADNDRLVKRSLHDASAHWGAWLRTLTSEEPAFGHNS